MGFDVDSCCVGYDGSDVWCLPRAQRALSRRFNLADPERLSPTYETRLAKYATRGFAVAVPGYRHDEEAIGDISDCRAPLEGLAKLLQIEQRQRQRQQRKAAGGGDAGAMKAAGTISSELLAKLELSRRRIVRGYPHGRLNCQFSSPHGETVSPDALLDLNAANELAGGCSDYSSTFLPPGLDAWQLFALLKSIHDRRLRHGMPITALFSSSFQWLLRGGRPHLL